MRTETNNPKERILKGPVETCKGFCAREIKRIKSFLNRTSVLYHAEL